MFKEADYSMGAFGKWGLGGPGSEGVPEKKGFLMFYSSGIFYGISFT